VRVLPDFRLELSFSLENQQMKEWNFTWLENLIWKISGFSCIFWGFLLDCSSFFPQENMLAIFTYIKTPH
jgi:hypothetical protein